MNQFRFLVLAGAMLIPRPALLMAQDNADRAPEIAAHQQKAKEYLREKQPKLAIPEFQALVALEPDNVEDHANLGVLLFFQNDYTAAIPQLKVAVAMKPELWRICALLGDAEMKTGDTQDGRGDLEAAFPHIEDEKLKINVGRDLIEVYAASDELDRAADMVATLLKLEPTNPSLLYTSYRIHTDLAATAMLELGLVAPNSAQTHQAMAHELQRDHDNAGSIANLKQAVALDPALPGGHFELAEALHASDDQHIRAQAENEYKLAITANPQDAKALARMGDFQVEKGDTNAAKQYYQQALQLQPGSADAAVGLAGVLSEEGKLEEALKLLLQVEAADPTNILAHYRLSTVYRKLKRPDDVKRELELYQRYKQEREKLKAVYQQMRLAAPAEQPEK